MKLQGDVRSYYEALQEQRFDSSSVLITVTSNNGVIKTHFTSNERAIRNLPVIMQMSANWRITYIGSY